MGLTADKLIAFFRSKDKTSDLVGRLQAASFQVLAALAGHGEVPTRTQPRTSSKTTGAKTRPTKAKTTKTEESAGGDDSAAQGGGEPARDVGLTVRIEVNLPAGGGPRDIRQNFSKHS